MTLLKILILFSALLPTILLAQSPLTSQKTLLYKQSFTVQALVDKTIFEGSFNHQQTSENPLNNNEEITMQPWNLGLRFALELSALTAMGY